MAGATIYDVAARAGVSIKTVSRVVNREANVSPALRQKVEDAVAALGYRRSLSARALAGSNSTIIAALVDAELTIEHWKSGRGNDYLSRLELGALMECRRAEYHLMVELVDHGAATLERDMLALLGSIRPAGVLLTPPELGPRAGPRHSGFGRRRLCTDQPGKGAGPRHMRADGRAAGGTGHDPTSDRDGPSPDRAPLRPRRLCGERAAEGRVNPLPCKDFPAYD